MKYQASISNTADLREEIENLHLEEKNVKGFNYYICDYRVLFDEIYCLSNRLNLKVGHVAEKFCTYVLSTPFGERWYFMCNIPWEEQNEQ